MNADNVMLNDGKLYYVVREKDENGKVTSTAYYQLDLKEKSSEIIGGEDKKEDQPLPYTRAQRSQRPRQPRFIRRMPVTMWIFSPGTRFS